MLNLSMVYDGHTPLRFIVSSLWANKRLDSFSRYPPVVSLSLNNNVFITNVSYF